MMTSRLRAILLRFAIPAGGLAAVALSATLYVNFPHTYHRVMTTVIALPGPHPFTDWEEVAGAIECSSKGLDVYVNNPCFTAVPTRFNYSPLWLRFSFIRHGNWWTNLFGFSFAVLFFLSLSLLPSPRTARFDLVVTLFCAISSATVFAVERANADLLVFLMILMGVFACGSRLPVRLFGYAVITLAGLLKFYPIVALIIAIRERPAVFAAIAFIATTALGGLVLSYHAELVQMTLNLPSGILFHPLQFSAYDIPNGLGVAVSKVATKLLHQDAARAKAIGRVIHNSLLVLLIVVTLVAAIWFGRRYRLQYAVRQLDIRGADFLLVGAAIICGCFFANENALYRGIFLLLALPGLLALARELPLRLGRAAFRATCVVIVFVLWFPFEQECVRLAFAALGKLVNVSYQGMDRPVRFVMWLCDQLSWWWIITVLLAILGSLAVNSELWSALSGVSEPSKTVNRSARGTDHTCAG
jgi:hypothetical protein